MKKVLFCVALLAFTFLTAQYDEKVEIPEGIVYNFGSSEQNKEAYDMLKKAIDQPGYYPNFDKIMFVGPVLWSIYETDPQLTNLNFQNVSLIVDDETLTAQASLDQESSEKVWEVFRNEITEPYTIRKANETELILYWTIISWDIDEPLYVVESGDRVFLIDFQKENNKVFWIDEVPLFALEDEEDIGFLDTVILLSEEEEFENNISLEDTMAIIEDSSTLFDETFMGTEKSGTVRVDFTLNKDKNEMEYEITGEVDSERFKTFKKLMENYDFPHSKNDPLRIALVFSINND